MDETFHVVVNDEEQYSVWPTYLEVPAGWAVVGEPDTREVCLDRIEQLWTDITPLSVRRARES